MQFGYACYVFWQPEGSDDARKLKNCVSSQIIIQIITHLSDRETEEIEKAPMMVDDYE